MTTRDDEAVIEHLVVALAHAMLARGGMIVTAESCTGGMIAAALTSIAGSSVWFERGFVTYSDDAKIELLGVDPRTLDSQGAVSEATAAEMARGAVSRSRADLAVSVTGVAGPGGGSPHKPVGTVCFGWCVRDEAPQTARLLLSGDRAAVRRASVRIAVEGLLVRANPQHSG